MDTAALNSLDLYKQFEEINIPEKQARLFANLFARVQKTEDLATKSDVENDFKILEVSQDRKFDQVRHELREEAEKIRREMGDIKSDLIRWMVGISIGQSALLASLIFGSKLFGG